MGRLARFRLSERGSAAIEFAIIAPVMLLLAGGVAEFGRALQANNEANRLATQYAIAYADCSDEPVGRCASELLAFGASAASANISPTLNASNVKLSMFQFRMAGSTPIVTYSYPASLTLDAAQATAARAAVSDGETGVLVTVTYTHDVALFQKLMKPYLGTALSFPYTIAQLKS